jgi:hypothetical protein
MPLPSFDDVIKGKKSSTGLPSFDDVIKSSQQRIMDQEHSDFAQMNQAQQDYGRMFAQQNADEQALIDQRQMEEQQQLFENMPKVKPAREQGRDLPVIGPVLRGLDAVGGAVEDSGVGPFMRSLYTPGAGAANIASYIGAAGNAVSRALPKLGNSIGGRAVSGAIQGAAVEAPVAVGQALSSQTNQVDEALKQGAIGGVMGGVLGGAAPAAARGATAIAERYKGTRIGDILGKYFAEPVKEAPQLALPEGRGTQRLEAAEARRVQPYGSEPVATPYTLKLQEPSEQTVRQIRNVEESKNDLLDINNHLRELQQQYDKAVVDQYKLLKEQLRERGGVQQGGLIVDNTGEVAGRYGRTSNNPQWYREFYAEHGKVPSNKDLYNLAKKHIDEGYADDAAQIPSWKQDNAYDDTVAALTQVRDQLRNSLKEEGLGITDAKLKDQVLADRRVRSNSEPVQPLQQIVEPKNMPPVLPRQSTPIERERGFASTLKASEKTPQGFVEKLNTAYRPITNQETIVGANRRIDKDVEEATSYALGNSRFSADKAAVGQRLIDHYNNTGNVQRAVDIAEKIAEEATRAGQAIQALSMFNRLTPEGVLVYAQRIARKTNENISITGKEVKVTEDMATKLTGLAQVSQKMTGVKDLANDVMNILEKAKTGEALTDTEAAALKRFVIESKQFIKETTSRPKPPKAPQQSKDKRIRDGVTSFLDAQEQAAKERLRARGIQISSTPLDIWADYAVIGAAKMAKGAIRFTDWSEQMVKELGEEVRPHLQQLYDRAREAYEQSSKVVTKQTVSQAERIAERVIANKQLGQSEADSIRTLAKKVSALSGDAKTAAAQDLQVVLQALDRPGVLKKVNSAQTIGQLLNPKTQVRNAVGNELFYRIERLNKYLATPIDIARSKITGGERTVTFRTNNQGEYWENWMRGLKAGWKGVNVNGLETQYDLSSPAFTSKYNPLTYMEKALGASLKSFDTASYMRAYNNTIGEQATLRAINEGRGNDKALIQKYIREADDNIMNIADQYGRYVTMQDNNLLSQGLVKLKRGLNFNKDFGIGDLVLKYPKTPGALLMRALEYSPAGFVRSGMILSRPLFKKEPNTAEVTQALSRAIIGTMGLTGMGYFLMDKGILTGAASKDKDIRELQRAAGQGQYQVNLSALTRFVLSGFDPAKAKLEEGDLLYTYDWAQPVSMATSIGANIRSNMSAGKQKFDGTVGTAYNTLEGGLGTLTEQSVLSGLKRAAEGYPGQTITDKIMDILSDIPASFVPTASNQANQLMDNNRRETYSPSKLEQSFNRAAAKIPGFAQTLPKQFDTLGRPKENVQDNNAFNVLFNPGNASRYELTPEAKMIIDLITETGDESLAPRVPGKTIQIQDPNDRKKTIKLQLNGDQFSRYQQLQGEETRENLIKRYRPEASQNSRVDRMRNILTESGDRAKKDLKKELGVR